MSMKINEINNNQENLNILNNTVTPITQEGAKTIALAKFKEKNVHDEALENKVMFIQRHVRAKIRKDSEIVRISNDPKPGYWAVRSAERIIEEANTPYRPKKCRPELADRIMAAADHVKLYSTVTHLAAEENIDKIIDGCLFGGKNLEEHHIKYRKAALSTYDVAQGDGNVICFGPDLIDPICIKDGTIGLEFDLEKILDVKNFNRNPSIFFKQTDFQYQPGIQTVNIKNETLSFKLRNNFIGEKIFIEIYKNEHNKDYLDYDTQSSYGIRSYNLISYNLEYMQKILALNPFKFIDELTPGGEKLTQHIYNLIDQLNDKELHEFLTDLGKKMSCSSEFNFYGAYKIDLNALVKLKFYLSGNRRETTRLQNNDITIEMKQLFDELNNGCFETFDKLKQLAPNLIKSARFIDFILSKITDLEIAAEVKASISGKTLPACPKTDPVSDTNTCHFDVRSHDEHKYEAINLRPSFIQTIAEYIELNISPYFACLHPGCEHVKKE